MLPDCGAPARRAAKAPVLGQPIDNRVVSTATGDHQNKPFADEFYRPQSSLVDGADTGLEYFMTLGGKKITTFPVGPEAASEMYYRLKCAAGNHDAYLSPIGITFEEFLNKDSNTGERNFLIGQDLEVVAHAGFTGEDFGGGKSIPARREALRRRHRPPKPVPHPAHPRDRDVHYQERRHGQHVSALRPRGGTCGA